MPRFEIEIDNDESLYKIAVYDTWDAGIFSHKAMTCVSKIDCKGMNFIKRQLVIKKETKRLTRLLRKYYRE